MLYAYYTIPLSEAFMTECQMAEAVKARPPGTRLSAIEGEIQASALFGPVTTRRYPWTAEYTAYRYVNLLPE
jgi:hypothetical protein